VNYEFHPAAEKVGDRSSISRRARGHCEYEYLFLEVHTMNEIIFLVEEADDGGFTARALGESIFTEADDLKQLHQHIREAVQCHFDDAKTPKVIRLHFVREEVIGL
jgi:hypothetical protein